MFTLAGHALDLFALFAVAHQQQCDFSVVREKIHHAHQIDHILFAGQPADIKEQGAVRIQPEIVEHFGLFVDGMEAVGVGAERDADDAPDADSA